MGAFALKGKFTNVSELTNQKLVQNNEVVNLMASIGLKLGQKPDLKDLRYGKILLYVDADCLEENTIILTKNGEKKISDIDYNDEILTHTGEYKKVKNIISKDISKHITIKVNGNTIFCSEDHKLIVFRDGKIEEIKAKDLKYSDFLLLKDKN
jgi:nitrous oxidase accessory protein NosD